MGTCVCHLNELENTGCQLSIDHFLRLCTAAGALTASYDGPNYMHQPCELTLHCLQLLALHWCLYSCSFRVRLQQITYTTMNQYKIIVRFDIQLITETKTLGYHYPRDRFFLNVTKAFFNIMTTHNRNWRVASTEEMRHWGPLGLKRSPQLTPERSKCASALKRHLIEGSIRHALE